MTVEYQRRLEKHYDELKWLYCELYPNGQGRFEELCAAMEQWYKERNKKWKALDRKREKQKDWYKSQKMLGMMLYIDAFADNISGLEKKLDYLKECNVNYLHLMPFLATPKGKSDGGYAVADYRTVQPSLGTMEDLDDQTSLFFFVLQPSSVNFYMFYFTYFFCGFSGEAVLYSKTQKQNGFEKLFG